MINSSVFIDFSNNPRYWWLLYITGVLIFVIDPMEDFTYATEKLHTLIMEAYKVILSFRKEVPNPLVPENHIFNFNGLYLVQYF